MQSDDNSNDIYKIIAKILHAGGIIAYPTEAVYGLGCDPLNEASVLKLLALKKREVAKGLILLASSWSQIEALIAIEKIPKDQLVKIKSSWPGPITWIFPAAKKVPKWITGAYESVAIIITAHPIAKAICENFGGAIVSTSANVANNSPAKTYDELIAEFGADVFDMVLVGAVGKLEKPTPIYDALTGKAVR